MTTSPELVTRSPEETESAAEQLGRRLGRGDLLLLAGPMGAGKTTFVRGLARGLGTGGDVMSPTFQLVRVYPGRVQLAHADLFRLAEAGELADLGFDELLDQGVLVIEWGDRLSPGLAEAVTIRIRPEGGDLRRLTIEGGDGRWCW